MSSLSVRLESKINVLYFRTFNNEIKELVLFNKAKPLSILKINQNKSIDEHDTDVEIAKLKAEIFKINKLRSIKAIEKRLEKMSINLNEKFNQSFKVNRFNYIGA